jgi:diguanylate cyclase (GGDEF)-like protein
MSAAESTRLSETSVDGAGSGASDRPLEVRPAWSLDARQRRILRLARQLLLVGLAALAATLLVTVWRSPTDAIAILGVAAYAAVVGALLAEYRVGRALDERRATRQAGRTRMLQGISRSVSSEAIVDTFVDNLRHAADADHIVVARLRPVERVVETTLLSSRAMLPPARSILPAGVLEPTNAGRARSRRGRPVLSGGGDTAQEIAESLAARLGQTYALLHTLAAPLVADGRVVGALILSRRQERDWSMADRRLLAFSAEELSAALARAFAFEEAEIRANIDALTGLPNRRYLEELLATVGPRRRSGDRLGALMIDLDHFKLLNDRYGHAAGDRVLRAVAERISDAVRADDTPARYGGEEFAVVLRRATPEQAVEVAERIRRQIAETPPSDLGISDRVTVSVGVAIAGSDESDAGAVLVAADRALYRAKREGRNRVVLGG